MSVESRKEYISALYCLKDKPAQTNQDDFPGARTRWDDFAVGHLINVMSVHRSPWLAVWHRHYNWRLERALREECGYTGGLPYWHWSKYLDQDINTWPLFDGSETSISGNGTQTGPQCACVGSGPLANWTINLGPQGEGTWGCKRNPQSDGRDANAFARLLELESPGTHNAPHLFMGGTQIDVTFSSQDPWFFFHHAMVDFVWTVWQSVDFDARTTTLPEPSIFDEMRSQGWGLPTPRVSLDSQIYLSPVFNNITVREAMWTTRNLYCYRYE
ncbi:hypothetical protein M409DRAFT_69436 [Zasmidium cellare ATCC 36951]|uniref:Tyrosinase copper-binding domain-containing protein n=1 Tax=Zasmidium cellare ATCC 36951 TaxID=1080233 RepID=A0A6A6C8Z3_ZASCE|nr:uncharacterized protein M409DRAFT_69436 [Zasmidium cellare ATCC 36951]KAF2161906.1 hypothetical protein M409DRAFT_69436 [Zasmidium cellare ATCC 36951]